MARSAEQELRLHFEEERLPAERHGEAAAALHARVHSHLDGAAEDRAAPKAHWPRSGVVTPLPLALIGATRVAARIGVGICIRVGVGVRVPRCGSAHAAWPSPAPSRPARLDAALTVPLGAQLRTRDAPGLLLLGEANAFRCR